MLKTVRCVRCHGPMPPKALKYGDPYCSRKCHDGRRPAEKRSPIDRRPRLHLPPYGLTGAGGIHLGGEDNQFARPNAKWCMKCGEEGLSLTAKVCSKCGNIRFVHYHSVDGPQNEPEEGISRQD